MIPKKIHYCWLSGDPLPEKIKQCMKTWQDIMPDYELVLWDINKFDVKSVPFVYEAYQRKKWAFASDYIRLYALYTEGGIYLDTDVIIKKRFDDLLDCNFFTSVEHNVESKFDEKTMVLAKAIDLDLPKNRKFTIQAAVIGGVAKHPYIEACMRWYENKNFINDDGSYLDTIIAPDIYANILKKFGFIYKDELQFLPNGAVIYPSYTFPNGVLADQNIHPETYAIHCFFGDWRINSWVEKKLKNMISSRVLRMIFRKKLYKTVEEIINDNNKN